MSLLTWIDLETTGLPDLAKQGVYQHKILEIAIAVTDTDFNVIDSLELVVGHDKSVLDLCDDIVRQMHTQNGLFQECFNSDLSIESAQKLCLEFLDRVGVEKSQSPLCGSSVFIERAFLGVHMPELDQHLHYRSLDVSSVFLFLDSSGLKPELRKQTAHRAMGDIRSSIQNGLRFKEFLSAAP